MNQHEKDCDCYECNVNDPYILKLREKANKAYKINSAGKVDNLEGFDDKMFLDGDLKTIVSLPIYKSPGGAFLRNSKQNEVIGKIYAPIKRNDGIWLMIDTPTKGEVVYIKHEPWKYDLKFLEESIKKLNQKVQQAIGVKVEERKQNNTSTLYQSGKTAIQTTKDVAKGIKDVTKGTFETIGFIGRNLKIVVIFVIIGLVVSMLSKTKILS